MSSREGNLEAPTRHPLDWQNPEFYDEAALFKEMKRVFEICHGCRRCISLCRSFPTLFDLVDNSESMEVDGVAKADYWQMVDQCYLCDMCYMTKCPYVPPHPWNLDFPHLMLRAKALKFRSHGASLRDRLLSSTDALGKLAPIPAVVSDSRPACSARTISSVASRRSSTAARSRASTTIRGGFGVSTFPWNVDTYASNGLGNAFTSSGNENDSTGNVYPVVILSADGNTNYQLNPKGGAALGSSINSRYKFAPLEPDGYNGQGVGFVQYDSPVPTLKMWNLTVQRHLGGNMMFEIGYVGSRGTNMPFYTDLNQVPEDKLGPGDAIYRPYPFQSITGVSTAGASNYNALQGMISRRMSNGLEFNFNYTWSHMQSTQDSSGWGTKQGNTPYQSAYFPLRNYGNSNFDVRQMFKGQAVYELPFGIGRKYINNNAVADRVLGSWTLAGTVVTQTGNPFTPYMATNNSYALSSNMQQFPDVVGNPVLSNPDINGWFNVSALTAPTAGTFGNMGRNSLFGPGLSQVGLSLLKTFVIHEEIRFDFSVNSTNILNHPSFALPDLLVGPGHVGAIRGVTVSGRHIEFIGKLRF